MKVNLEQAKKISEELDIISEAWFQGDTEMKDGVELWDTTELLTKLQIVVSKFDVKTDVETDTESKVVTQKHNETLPTTRAVS